MEYAKLSLEEAVEEASARYRPGSIHGGAARNMAIEAWGQAVGRERALREWADLIERHGSRRGAARALRMGIDAFGRIEESLRSAPIKMRGGLTLTLDTRLHRFDPTAFDVLIAQVLGPDTDVTIEERSNLGAEGPAFIRLNGANPNDLVAVANAFYDRVWREAESVAEERAMARALSSGMGLVLARLDELRTSWSGASLSAPAVPALFAGLAEANALAEEGATRRMEELRQRLLQERGAREALCTLIAHLLAPGTVHPWASAHFESAVPYALPGPTASHEAVVHELVGVLERRGLVDTRLFVLLAGHRPDAAELTGGVASLWGIGAVGAGSEG